MERSYSCTVQLLCKARGFGGAVALEYEIRDDLNRLQGLNVAILHPKDGETWADVIGFATAWLGLRAAQWELSDTDEQKERRKESRVGGKRLDAEACLLSKPRLSGTPPEKRRLAVSISRAQAEALAREDGLVEIAVGRRRQLVRATGAFRV